MFIKLIQNSNGFYKEMPSPLMLDGAPAIKGRYNLYPTENIFNFILLDQIDGYVYRPMVTK